MLCQVCDTKVWLLFSSKNTVNYLRSSKHQKNYLKISCNLSVKVNNFMLGEPLDFRNQIHLFLLYIYFYYFTIVKKDTLKVQPLYKIWDRVAHVLITRTIKGRKKRKITKTLFCMRLWEPKCFCFLVREFPFVLPHSSSSQV